MVFLDDDQRENAVCDTFNHLWLSWNEALASHDTRRCAWNVLRGTVMARAPHRDGRPELGAAAFDTVALQTLTDPADHAHQLTETLELFAAISRLPDRQLDIIVLRRLCGFTHESVSALLGTSLATVRSDERHAARLLESVIPRTPLQSPPRPQPHHPPRSCPHFRSTRDRCTATRARFCPKPPTQRGRRRPGRPVRNPPHPHPAHRRR
ncbi:RNA polymerase sigma factor [Streptomyces sp. DH1]|uniref:RNA polymerase sigma factor n=1 Tax=Streptomyces sp. DH1 TaxID=2857012 RepID=UPI001E5F8AC9|nr:sigma-70 family RNA polymerase sigma factor [Streptomyces sp. DH1]